MGDGLSAASHVVGALAPATWYEVAVQADSDAGPERVTLRADTHTLAGGMKFIISLSYQFTHTVAYGLL